MDKQCCSNCQNLTHDNEFQELIQFPEYHCIKGKFKGVDMQAYLDYKNECECFKLKINKAYHTFLSGKIGLVLTPYFLATTS